MYSYDRMKAGDERRISLLYKGQRILQVMSFMRGGEMITKVANRGVDIHLSHYQKGESVAKHVKHERQTGARRYTQKEETPRVQLVWAMATMIAPPDDPPPLKPAKFSKDAKRSIDEWFARVYPRVFHPPTDREVVVFSGPLGDLVNACLRDDRPNMEIDFAELEGMSDASEDELYDRTTERELARSGKKVGFCNEGPIIVFPISADLVMEVHGESVQRMSSMMEKNLGITGYFRALKRKGYLPKRIDID